jgi:flagellar biosynthesis protein FlhF
MNVKRFLAKTPREALAMVRQAFGHDAVVMQTKPAPDGVEMLAMGPDSVLHLDALGGPPTRQPDDVQTDVEELSMSTLSFQDYVRERMLRRRQAELNPKPPAHAAAAAPKPTAEPPVMRDEFVPPAPIVQPQPQRAPVLLAAPSASDLHDDVLAELRSMKGLIEERFSALAFMDKLQRQPTQARLAAKLLDAGFSPALVKKLVEAMPADVTDESTWGASVLERNLMTGDGEPALEDQGGVYALIGSTGVGKTTSTAKIAAAFAMKHGAGALGLITLDAYRLAAHEQLRAYGRILGVPVHTAHDRASLEDLLDLLSGKRMVLIDTAGTAQRDTRTAELLDMVSHRTIHKLLVVNAAAQGETIDDVLLAYRAQSARGAVLSKIDEAVKLGPALDALIRHKLPLLGVANGQRVPEDWHRLSPAALIQRALRERPANPWRLDSTDVNLLFAGAARRAGQPLHA